MFTGHEVKGTVASTKPELAKFLRGKVETAHRPDQAGAAQSRFPEAARQRGPTPCCGLDLRGAAKPGNPLRHMHVSFQHRTQRQAAVTDRTRNAAALVHTALKR